MNIFVLIVIVILLFIIAGVLIYGFIFKKSTPPIIQEVKDNQEELKENFKKIAQLVEIIREEKDKERDEKRDKERDKDLLDFAFNKEKEKRDKPTSGIMLGGHEDEKPLKIKGVSIPYGLSQMEKDVLEAFYNDKPLS